MAGGPAPEQRTFVEAGMGILMSVIMADGKYSGDELKWWRGVQHRHSLFRDVPPEAFNPMLHNVKAQMASRPWKELVSQWAAAVPEQHRVSMLELASELAVVDKELRGKEPEVIRHLWTSFGIDDDKARAIFMSKIEEM